VTLAWHGTEDCVGKNASPALQAGEHDLLAQNDILWFWIIATRLPVDSARMAFQRVRVSHRAAAGRDEGLIACTNCIDTGGRREQERVHGRGVFPDQ